MSVSAPSVRAAPRWDGSVESPPGFEGFDGAGGNLSIGSTGKVGILDLDAEVHDGITRVHPRYQSGPLCLMHPLYVDPGRRDMAFLYTIQLGDGLVQGDRYRIDVRCGAGSAVHVTTQAATKLFRMDHDYAAQLVNLTVGDGAFVEYLPDPVIPFRGSRFYQRVRITAAESATIILGEVLLPGRVARGEQHAYTVFHSDLEVSRPEGTLLFADRTSISPPLASPETPGRLGPGGVLASLYVLSAHTPLCTLTDQIWTALRTEGSVVGGVSELPNRCGAVVRMLGGTSFDVKVAFRRAWNQARLAVAGVPAPDLRKGS